MKINDENIDVSKFKFKQITFLFLIFMQKNNNNTSVIMGFKLVIIGPLTTRLSELTILTR